MLYGEYYIYKFIARKISLRLDSLHDSITDMSFTDPVLTIMFFVHLLLYGYTIARFLMFSNAHRMQCILAKTGS